MVAINNITFIGKSSFKYDFHAYPLDEEFYHIEAVYAVTHSFKNRFKKYNHRIIYIGETRDLSTCLKDHPEQTCFQEHDINCICVYPEKSQEKRLRIRGDLVGNYRPPCC